jgi:aminomethyltransferase
MQGLKTTPLSDWHRAHGARMVPFAGWEMPVQYRSIIAEHLHTRSQASLFDICHMGELIVSGPGSRGGLAGILTHDLETLLPGRCRYGFMLNPAGGILDDLIVYCLDPERFMLVVNAACAESDVAWIEKHLPGDAVLEDISLQTAKIDLQGPLSFEVLQSALEIDVRMGYFSFRVATFQGGQVTISRTGYTGELGFEIYLPAGDAAPLWELLVEDPGCCRQASGLGTPFAWRPACRSMVRSSTRSTPRLRRGMARSSPPSPCSSADPASLRSANGSSGCGSRAGAARGMGTR